MTEKHYEQFLQLLIDTEPIEITPNKITKDVLDELEFLENLSQERICQACEHKQLEHTEWCYIFKKMFQNCHQFKKGERWHHPLKLSKISA